jgi:hypothetical protein
VRKLLVRIYPRAWRERYGDELLALVEQLPVAPTTVLDLLHGAAAAHWQEAHAWAGEIRRANRRQVLLRLTGAGVCGVVALAVFGPDLVTSTAVPRQVHAAVILLAVLFLLGSILRAVPDPAARSRRTRVTSMVALAAWMSYMTVWDPGAPTGPGTLPPWIGRSMYGLALIGCASYLVVEFVRAARRVPAGRGG